MIGFMTSWWRASKAGATDAAQAQTAALATAVDQGVKQIDPSMRLVSD